MRCKVCDIIGYKGDVFCWLCGRRLTPSPKNLQCMCGSTPSKTDHFCPRCGKITPRGIEKGGIQCPISPAS